MRGNDAEDADNGMMQGVLHLFRFVHDWNRCKSRKLQGGIILTTALVIMLLRISVGLTDTGIRLGSILAPIYCCIMYYLFAMFNGKSIFRVLEYLGIICTQHHIHII